MNRIIISLALLLIALAGNAQIKKSGNAQKSPKENTEFIDITIEQDKAVFTTEFGVNYYKHTATKDGILSFHPLNYASIVFYATDANNENQTNLPVKQDAEGQNYYQATVKEGETYYFCTSLILDSGSQFEVFYDEGTSTSEIVIKSSYKDGDTFSPSGSNLELIIDREVEIESFNVLYGDGQSVEIPSSDIVTSYFNSYFCVIDLTPTINKLIENSSLKMGDEFTVKLGNIRDRQNPDNKYGETGDFEVSLILGKIPAEVTSIDPAYGSDIKTYYPEGGSEGYITFTFSEDIKPATEGGNIKATYAYGDVEASSYVIDEVPATIEGNKVIVNIQGITFPEEVMTATSGMVQTNVTIKLENLITVDDNTIAPNMEKAIGATFSVVKENINFYADYIPGVGMSVDGLDEIIIFTNVEIMFDGVNMEYTDQDGASQKKLFKADEYPSVYSDEYEGYIITLPLDGLSFSEGDVKVSVENAKLMNGESVTIEATFKTSDRTGIDSVISNDKYVKVYDLNGLFVAEGYFNEIISSLEKNKTYIIEGTKMMLTE